MTGENALARLREEIAESLDYARSESDESLLERIERHVFRYSQTHHLTAAEKKETVLKLYHSFRGLDVLQPLIDDPSVTEIMINNHREIFVEREGRITRAPVRFESEEKLEDIIQTIVAKTNRMVNEASPIVDARLQDGSRVHVVLPPIALNGPTMTIRKFPEQPMSLDDLTRSGTITEEAAHMLRNLVKAKYNIFISGGTSSGKTTFLNALARCIPADERIITIEDSAELQIKGIPNLVRLETRNPNSEGKGLISMRDLIRASLRMRPNRIIVGEVRGEEAFDMLQAMNTGHAGSLSTGHGNSAADMMSRLETMVLAAARLPIDVVRKQIASALDIVVHLARFRDRTRKVAEICEVAGVSGGEIVLHPLFRFAETDEGTPQRVSGILRKTGELQNRQKLQQAGFERSGAAGEGVAAIVNDPNVSVRSAANDPASPGVPQRTA